MLFAHPKWVKFLTHDGRFTTEHSDYRRVYLIHVLLLLLMGNSILFVVVDALVFRMIAATVVNLAAGLAAMWILRRFLRRNDVEWAASAVAFMILAVLAAFLLVVEQQHYAFVFITIVPPVIFFLLDSRRAIGFTIAFFAFFAAFIGARNSSWQPSPFNPQSIFNLVGAFLAMILVVRFFAKSRDDAVYALEEKKRALETSHQDLAEKKVTLEQQKRALEENQFLLESRNRELERLSITDRLTGVYNRMKLDQVIDEEMARARNSSSAFAIILADVDHFKRINDRFGHLAGDQVLIRIASSLRANCRSIDSVGRWGGEEFLVICPECDAAGARLVADRLLTAMLNEDFGLADEAPDIGSDTPDMVDVTAGDAGVSEDNCINRRGFALNQPAAGEPASTSANHVTLSLGIATLRSDDTWDSLLKRADDAMYLAKKLGRQRVEAIL